MNIIYPIIIIYSHRYKLTMYRAPVNQQTRTTFLQTFSHRK